MDKRQADHIIKNRDALIALLIHASSLGGSIQDIGVYKRNDAGVVSLTTIQSEPFKIGDLWCVKIAGQSGGYDCSRLSPAKADDTEFKSLYEEWKRDRETKQDKADADAHQPPAHNIIDEYKRDKGRL